MPKPIEHLIGSLRHGESVPIDVKFDYGERVSSDDDFDYGERVSSDDDFDYAGVMWEVALRRANAFTPPAGEPDRDLIQEIQGLYENARHAMAYRESIAAGGIVTGIEKTPAVRALSLDIRSTRLADRQTTDEYVFTPTVRLPAETNRMSASLLLNSLVSQAGTRIIIAEPRPASAAGDIMPFYRDAGVFRLVESATYAHVPDGAEVTESAQPFFTAPIPMDESVAYAFRTKITRKQLKDVGGARTMEAVATAITLGLANLADKVLLSAIAAATPQAFTLAKAASRGLRFHELRAFVGNTGAGVQVDNGRLNVAGVSAELTPAISATVVGAFNRAAVAVYPIIQVHIERTNLNGDVQVTTWANMIPLIPDANAFWTVS